MGVKVLEAGSLTEAKELVMMIEPSSSSFSTSFDNDPACFGNQFLDESMRADGDADADEALRTERGEQDAAAELGQCGVVVNHDCCQIKRRLLADALRKDGCLRYVEVKPGIFLEDVLELRQDL